MPGAVNGVIHPDTIDHEQHPVGFHPADDRASTAKLGFAAQ
jgi:hypothetical protein